MGNWREGSVDFLTERSLETFASSHCRCYSVYLNSSRLLIAVSARLARSTLSLPTLSYLRVERVLCFSMALRPSIQQHSSFLFGTHEGLNRNSRKGGWSVGETGESR